MTAEVDDGFFQLFERRIFVRGEAYYDAGKVDPPVMIAENLWHTVVRGNDDYQVDIRLRHGKVISAACTCQYSQRAMYCKHVAAVLILMRESRRRELDESQDQVSEFPHARCLLRSATSFLKGVALLSRQRDVWVALSAQKHDVFSSAHE